MALPQGSVGQKALKAPLLAWPRTPPTALRGPAGSQRGFAARKRELVAVPSPQGAMPGLIASGFWKPQSIGKYCKEPKLPVQECIFLIHVKPP